MLLALAPSPSSGAETDLVEETPLSNVDEDDYLILKLEMGKYLLAEAVEGYRTPSGGLCLDFQQTVDALEFPVKIDPVTATADGWLHSEQYGFALSSKSVRYGDNRTRIEGSELLRHSGGLCISEDALSRWFGLDIAPKLDQSLVRISSEKKLPFERVLDREQRRKSLSRRDTAAKYADLPAFSEPYRLWRTPSVDLVLSAGGRRDRARISEDLRYNLYGAGEVAFMSVDARLASDDNGAPDALRLRAYRQDAEGRLFGALGATEFVLGDVTLQRRGIVAPSAVGRGAWISNRPLVRANDFDTTAFFGELPIGWEAELYRNGALIAFAEPTESGRYAFEDVPLLYGENRFEIVLYGPQGQERRERFIRQVGERAVPAGTTWYRAGVVEDRRDLVRLDDDPVRTPLRAVAGIEHGLSKRVSVGLAAHLIEDEAGRIRKLAEASVRHRFGGAVVEADLAADADGGLGAALRFAGRTGDTSLFLGSEWQNGLTIPRLGPGTKSQHEARAIQQLDIGGEPATVSVNARYREIEDREDLAEVTGQVSSRIGRLSVAQEVGWRQDGGTDDGIAMRTQIGGSRGRLSLRGEADYRLGSDSRFERARLTATYRLKNEAQLRAETQYDGVREEARLRLGYAKRFDRFALGANIEADTNGRVAAGVNLAVSVGPGTDGRFARLSRDPLAARGQVAARVFTDVNGDGVWQDEEPLHPEARVTAGNRARAAESGEDGIALISGLTSGARTLIRLDGASVDDPLLVAGEPRVVVTRRGLATAVDLPLTPTGEVEGELWRDGQPVAGADLELVDRAGQIIGRVRSDFDGYFLFERVPYGSVSLRFTTATARALGVGIDIARAEITADTPIGNLGTLDIAKLGSFIADAAREVVPHDFTPPSR
ncbi:MAG: carboxypeptidase-like regulatory domain-containing protein [Pacificimonas sp.]